MAVANFWTLLVNFLYGRPCDVSARETLVQSRSLADNLIVNARALSEGPLSGAPELGG